MMVVFAAFLFVLAWVLTWTGVFGALFGWTFAGILLMVLTGMFPRKRRAR